MAGRLEYLDSLRGIAAVSVAIFHFRLNSYFNGPFIDNAGLMVDFFFVLSGFVISLNYNGRLNSRTDLFNFCKNRFLRVYPLHILILVLFILVELLKLVLSLGSARFGAAAFSGPFGYSLLPDNFLLIQNFTSANLSWNAPSWSISAEFYTYILFGVVVLFFTKFKYFVVSLILVVCAIFYATDLWSFSSAEVGYLRCFFCFFIGVLGEKLSRNILFVLPQFIGIFAMGGVYLFIVEAKTLSHFVIAFPVLCASLIVILTKMSCQSFLLHTLRLKPLVYFGSISYGIYMIHWLLWRLIGIFLSHVYNAPLAEAPGGGTYFDLPFSTMTLTFFHVLSLGVLIALAGLSYRFFEKPVMARLMTK